MEAQELFIFALVAYAAWKALPAAKAYLLPALSRWRTQVETISANTSKDAKLAGGALLLALYLSYSNGAFALPAMPKLLEKLRPTSTVEWEKRFPVPAPELKAKVEPLVAKFAEKPDDAAKFAGLYESIVILMETRPDLFNTTTDLRNVTIQAGVVSTQRVLGTEKTGEKIEEFIMPQLGELPVPLDDSLRAKAKAVYAAVAWAAATAADSR